MGARGTVWQRLLPGMRAGLPFAVAGTVLGVSFGVLARPVMGPVATIVMSAILFAGSAQFAATAVLASGGSASAAIVAGTLLNARFVPMGIAVAPSLSGGRLARAAQGWTVIDVSWALANRGDGRFDRWTLLGSSLVHYPLWIAGTSAGVLAGDVIDPKALGLDAIFPAFFLGLLVGELRHRLGAIAALCGALIALALIPLTPPGIPVLAASLAGLLGLRAPARPEAASSVPSPGEAERGEVPGEATGERAAS